MSTLQFHHFYCPHCQKRFAKDDPTFTGAEMHRAIDEAMGVGGVLGVLNESVPCPNPQCGKPIPLAGIFQGRFDSPRLTPKGCLLWIVYLGVALLVIRILLAIAEKKH